MFDHVILTRFNLATAGREEDVRNRPGWLSRRFDLFERFCLPSIVEQENQDFIWIIYFDKDTPQFFRDRIVDLQNIYPFVPYFTGLFPAEGWRNSVREVLADRDRAPELLISTRLDNDDALARDYTSRIRSVARLHLGKELAAFNITQGCIMTEDRIYKTQHNSNAFFSVLEPFDDTMKTAPAIQHMTLASHGPVVQIPGPPGWLQIVHGENVSNKIRGTRICPTEVENYFYDGAVNQIPIPSRSALFLENVLLAPLRRFRDGIASQRRQPTY